MPFAIRPSHPLSNQHPVNKPETAPRVGLGGDALFSNSRINAAPKKSNSRGGGGLRISATDSARMDFL